MASVDNILISLEPGYAEAILSGVKTYELRRRPFRVQAGTRLWLYAKKPVGAVVGYATISRIHAYSPAYTWRKFRREAGILRKDFLAYFGDRSHAYAIEVRDPVLLKVPLSLEQLRLTYPSFHPPQFFKRFESEDSVLKVLLSETPQGDS